jgi:hypothetical protein
MDNRINEIRKKIRALRVSRLEAESIMRDQVNRDEDCSFVGVPPPWSTASLGGKTFRTAVRAADALSVCHQPEDREIDRPRNSGNSACARRRSDRVSRELKTVEMSPFGTFETCQPAVNMSGYRVPEVSGARSK